MEEWQSKFITENLPSLIKLTTCDTQLLTNLISKQILTDSDGEILESKRYDGQQSQSRHLYTVLQTKKDAYEELASALYQTKQSGAYELIKAGFPSEQLPEIIKRIEDNRIYFIREIKQTTGWNEISKRRQDEFVGRTINFMSKKITIKQLFTKLNLSEANFGEIINSTLDGDSIRRIFNYDYDIEVNNGLRPESISYYVERKLISRNEIDPRIFDEVCSDVFVVKFIEMHTLSNLVKHSVVERSTSQLGELTGRYIAQEFDNHFATIVNLGQAKGWPVHQFEYRQGKLYWVASHGNFSTIQQFLRDEDEETLRERQAAKIFASTPHPVIISATAGMGKSELLENLGRSISSTQPERLVLFVTLRKFIDTIHENNVPLMDAEFLCKLLAANFSNSKFGQELLARYILEQVCQVELLLDGFDEILASQKDIAKKAVDCLAKMGNVRVYITTRPHLQDELEVLLNSVSYHISPFRKEEQFLCMVKYWRHEHKIPENYHLLSLAKKCLQVLSANMRETDREIAGVPLQCRLLAEVYLHLAKCCSEERQSLKYFEPLISVTSIFQLYDNHISIRFHEKLDKREIIFEQHVYLALQLFFPDSLIKFLYLSHPEVELDELLRVGLLERNRLDKSIKFIHQSVAEFLVAKFVVSSPDDKNIEHFSEFVLNEVMSTEQGMELPVHKHAFGEWTPITTFTFSHPVVSYFIDGLLHTQTLSSVEAPFARGGKVEGKYFEGVLTAAVCHDYMCIARILVDLHSKSEDNPPLPAYVNLLLLSAKHSSNGETLKILSRPKFEYKKVAFQNCKKYGFQLTPLHVAAHVGCFKSVEVLLKADFLYKNFIQKLQFLGHMCVHNSGQEKTGIGEKVDILRMLQQICKSSVNLLDEKLPDGTTPLLQKQVHFDLLKCLIESECDINCTNEDYECVLHTIFKNYSDNSQHIHNEKYHELVQLLQSRDFLHYDLRSKLTSRTPLHLAMQYIEITKKTLGTFISKKVDINSKDTEGNSILFVAVAFNRLRKLLVKLKRHGANSSHRNNLGETILHFASKHGNLNGVEEFFRDVDINEVDQMGNVALHFAVISKETKYEKIQIALIEEGANVNSINSLSLTPFLYGMKHGRGLSLKVISIMESKGLDIDPKMASQALKFIFTNMNTNGWNWDSELTKVAKYLIMKKSGVVKCQNLEVSSPWELEQVEDIMADLEKEIRWKETFVHHLRTFNLLIPNSEMALLRPANGRKIEKFLRDLRSVEGSYEKLMCSLIASDQKSPFLLLRQCLQAEEHESVIFVKPPPNFDLLQNTKGKGELLILSYDIQTTVTRILSTVDASIPVIDDINNLSFENDKMVPMVVVTCKDGDVIEEYFQRETTHTKLKIAFILYHLHLNESLSQNTDMNMTTDDISWKDLTFHLRKKMSKMILGKVVLTRDIFQELTATSLLPILKLTHNMAPFLCPSTQMLAFPLKFSRRNVLSPRVFEHHLTDLMIVNDMDEGTLKEYARWGQKIGVSYDQIKRLDADYIILKDNSHFEKICQIKRSGQNVHWLIFNENRFELKDSHGSISRICQFLESNPTNRVGSESFLENEHPIPSIILIKADVTSFHKIFDMVKTLSKKSSHAHFIELSLGLKRASKILNSNNSSLNIMLGDLLEINDLNFSEESSTWNIVFGTVLDESEESITTLRALIEKACQEADGSTITVRFWLLTVHNIWRFEQAFDVIGYELLETKPEEVLAFIANKYKSKNREVKFQTKLSSFVENYESKQKHNGVTPIISESFLNRTKLTFPLTPAVENFEFYAYLFDSLLLFEDIPFENYDIPPVEELCKKLFTHYFELVLHSVNKEGRHDIETKMTMWLICIALRSRFPQWLSVFKHMNCLSEPDQNDTLSHNPNNDITFVRKEMSDYVVAQIFIFPKFSEDLIRDEIVNCLRTLLTTFEPFHVTFPLRVFSHSGLLYFIDKLVREENNAKYFSKLVEDALENNDSNLAKDCIRACVLGSFVNILKVVLEKRLKSRNDILPQDLLDLAVMFANEEMMKFILEIKKCHRDISTISINGDKWAIPHLAARRGDYAVIKFLLRDGHLCENTNNDLLLHNCLIDSNLDRDEVILNKVKIIELVTTISGGKCLLERDSDGCGPLHMQTPHTELLRHLIKSGVDPSVQDNQGCTMLHYLPKYLHAAQYHELITYLISVKETKCLRIVDKDGCTFLHRAMLNPNISPETLHLLHAKRVNFKAVTRQYNPLLHCAFQGRANAAVIRTLLELTGFKTMDINGNTVLHLAAQSGNFFFLNFSLSESQDLNINAKNTFGITPLHLAFHGKCQGNLMKILKFLKENKADVNAEDQEGRSPVHWAATVCKSSEWLLGIQFLREHEGDLSKGDKTGSTILHIAPYYRTSQEFHQLVQLIVDWSLARELFIATCQFKCNPLHIAVRQLELERITLECLCSGGINAKDASGNPPLFYAIEGKRSEIFLEWMVELDADWRVANNKGHTAVHASVGTGNLVALAYLISKGIDTNTKDSEGNTPLHIAFLENIENAHDVVEILVQNGADVTLENCEGKSALAVATEMVESGRLDPRTLKLLSSNEQDANHEIIEIYGSNSTLSINLEGTKEIRDFDYGVGHKDRETTEEEELCEMGFTLGTTLPRMETTQTSLCLTSEGDHHVFCIDRGDTILEKEDNASDETPYLVEYFEC